MNRILLSLSLVALIAGCSTFKKPEPLPVVEQVNLDQFTGQWYVISSMPTMLDRRPYNATVQIDRADRGLRLVYKFDISEESTRERTIKARAQIDNPGINTDWSVTYAWPLGTDLRILYLEADYSVTVMGNPSRKKAWIMARQPTIDAPLYSDIILHLQELGYDIGKIRKVPQN